MKFKRLDYITTFAQGSTLLNNKILRVLNHSDKLDFRRKVTLSCMLTELYKNISELAYFILDTKQITDIKQFIDKCLSPLFINRSECIFHDLFVDILFINSTKTIGNINSILSKPISKENILEIFRFLCLFVEEIYISLISINVSCGLFKSPCDCSDECSCEDRGNTLTLFYSQCYESLPVMIDKYISLSEKYFVKGKVKFVIDFKYVKEPIKIEKEALDAIQKATKFFRQVVLVNTRIEKISINNEDRKRLINCIAN